MSETKPVVLSIAGSDSGGGAGIQADLRVFSRLGVFGTTVITAVTAQNLAGVRAVQAIDADIVADQLRAVLDGFPVRALKTGMLWSRAIIEVVVDELAAGKVRSSVIDPVMVATTGDRLLQENAVQAYITDLLPRCTLVTPNLDEAAILLGQGATSAADLPEMALALQRKLGCAVLLKGGHLVGDPVDLLCAGGEVWRWAHARIAGVNTHGSGCMLSAAIAAFLARGDALVDACRAGLAFVHDALSKAAPIVDDVCLAAIENATADSNHLTES